MIQFIGILCAVWLFVDGAESIQFIKRGLHLDDSAVLKKWYWLVIQYLINCCLCSGFWVGFIFYQDFWMACIVSLSCEAFHKIILKLGSYFLEV